MSVANKISTSHIKNTLTPPADALPKTAGSTFHTLLERRTPCANMLPDRGRIHTPVQRIISILIPLGCGCGSSRRWDETAQLADSSHPVGRRRDSTPERDSR